MEKEMRRDDTNMFVKQIGATIYQVKVCFDEGATKAFEEKMWKLISNDMAYGQEERNK